MVYSATVPVRHKICTQMPNGCITYTYTYTLIHSANKHTPMHREKDTEALRFARTVRKGAEVRLVSMPEW